MTTDAESCAANGWTVGTRLVGTETWDCGSSTTTLRITAIGERLVLAFSESETVHDGGYHRTYRPGTEQVWSLAERDWQPVNDEVAPNA